MDKFLNCGENSEITRKLLELVNRTTDDYLFFYDIEKDLNWFFGPIDVHYAVRKPGSPTNTIAEMLAIVHPADRKALMCDLEKIGAGLKDSHDMNYRWINRDGDIVWISCRGHVIFDETGKPSAMIGRVSEETLRYLYNPLTGLFNKQRLLDDLQIMLQTEKGTLMMLDIAGLASINLSHGRSYGDMLLKETAAYLESHRLIKQVYHTEHSCFAVVLAGENEDTAETLFSEFCGSFKEKCAFTACALPIDRDIFIDVSALVDSANVTLKKAKQHAGNPLVFFSPDEIRQRIESLTLLEELKKSVQCGFEGFELNYQPQLRCGSYEIYGAEALLRYTSKTDGRIFPDKLIPVLEESGLIVQVGSWVLEEALTQCRKWRECISDLHISVNFSSVQFEDRYLGEKIVDVLRKTGLPGNALTVELTESVQMHENVRLSKIIKYLKAYGVHFSIDDFGTGYSNLGYLTALDISEIKIDRSFVSSIQKDSYNYNLVNNIMQFAKNNAIRVCCEGVETTMEISVLESLQPDLFQGYLFDKPCTAFGIEQRYINSESDEYKKRLLLIKSINRFKEKQ